MSKLEILPGILLTAINMAMHKIQFIVGNIY